MKTLELDLKKKVFIVDTTAPIEAIEIDDYEFLCEGSELTEEIASELVETYEINFYVDYNSPNHYGYCFTSLESFISAVESKGFYWLKNPVKIHTLASENADEYLKKWQEAEEKTFRNPLIFVKK